MSVQSPMSAGEITSLLPDPTAVPAPSKIVALFGDAAQLEPLILQSLVIHAARGDRLAVLVGNNRLDAYRLARRARAQGFDPAVLLSRIALTRAFTCYQLRHALHLFGVNARVSWAALYVLGLLDMFYDEDVRAGEARRLLLASLSELNRLAASGLPVLVTVTRASHTRAGFVEMVRQTAHVRMIRKGGDL